MFKIDPDTLYSLEDLREQLHGLVELPTLMERLGLREGRIFKGAVWGFEILKAARDAKPYNEVEQASAAVVEMARGARAARGRRPATRPPTGRLSARDLDESR